VCQKRNSVTFGQAVRHFFFTVSRWKTNFLSLSSYPLLHSLLESDSPDHDRASWLERWYFLQDQQLQNPLDIVLNSRDNILIVDPRRERIQTFHQDGTVSNQGYPDQKTYENLWKFFKRSFTRPNFSNFGTPLGEGLKVKMKTQCLEDLSNIFALWQYFNQISRHWGCSPSHVFAIYLPSNQILWCWEFSQSRVSSMGIHPLEFHESVNGSRGNQAFSRSSSRPIMFSKGEKSEFTSHFSKFVTIGITLWKDCLKKMLIAYKVWP
jgi:hypothetical protein